MDRLNSELRQSAVEAGLCDKWQSMWNHTFDKDELIDMFKKGQDFCIINDYPSKEYIRGNFTTIELARNGIYVDENISLGEDRSLGNGTYVLLGSCTGTLRFGKWTAATVYLRHDSNVRVEAGAFARISVRLYDNADAETTPDEDARIRIFDRR